MISSTLLPMAISARRIGLVGLLSAALSLSTFYPAIADDDRSQPKPSAKIEFKKAKEKFKSEIDAYKSAIKGGFVECNNCRTKIDYHEYAKKCSHSGCSNS
jgi:hypothetical protein